jgi:predicted DNA-binding protein (MmcQ/YjbR family)
LAEAANRGPDLFVRAAFEAFVLALPAASLVRQWGDASVGKVGGKIFALFGDGGAGHPATISFKCSDLAFDLLPELAGIRPAPYLARAKWVAVGKGSALGDAEVAAYVTEAHRLVAARLPKRLQVTLGLDGVIAAARDRG